MTRSCGGLQGRGGQAALRAWLRVPFSRHNALQMWGLRCKPSQLAQSAVLAAPGVKDDEITEESRKTAHHVGGKVCCFQGT